MSIHRESECAEPRRLLRLGRYLRDNEIGFETYLSSLLRGLAPPPLAIGENLYLDRVDEAAFRTRLKAESLRRMADIVDEAGALDSTK